MYLRSSADINFAIHQSEEESDLVVNTLPSCRSSLDFKDIKKSVDGRSLVDLVESDLEANTASQNKNDDAEFKEVDAGDPVKSKKTETMSKLVVNNVTLTSEDGECASKGVGLNFSDVVKINHEDQ